MYRRNRLARVLSAKGGSGGKTMHVGPSVLEGAGRPAVGASCLEKTIHLPIGNLPQTIPETSLLFLPPPRVGCVRRSPPLSLRSRGSTLAAAFSPRLASVRAPAHPRLTLTLRPCPCCKPVNVLEPPRLFVGATKFSVFALVYIIFCLRPATSIVNIFCCSVYIYMNCTTTP